jgi:hypothetical protein
MRHKLLWLGFLGAFLLAVVAGDGIVAQPPGKKGGKGPKGPPDFQPVTVDAVVQRIMSFDANGDGKITKEELPERMQHLIALADTNKDGVLDREEVRGLAVTLDGLGLLNSGGGPLPPGGKGGPFNFVKAVDDLDLSGETLDKARKIAREQQDKIRKLTDDVRGDLLAQMKEILRDPDYRAFKAAVDFPPPKGKGKKGAGDF